MSKDEVQRSFKARASFKSDVFSLGMMFTMAFWGAQVAQNLSIKWRNDEPVIPNGPNTPTYVMMWKLVHSMCAFSPQERPLLVNVLTTLNELLVN